MRTSESSQQGIFSKLVNGDLGLAKTFVTTLLFAIIAGGIFIPLTSAGSLIIFIVFYTAGMIALQMGLWKAANKYQGSKIWSQLVKFFVVIDIIRLVQNWLNLPVLFGNPPFFTLY